jgi:hypothetical protein
MTPLAFFLIKLLRNFVRNTMKEYAPEGALLRKPGGKSKIARKSLKIVGPWQEIHADGHEKLDSKALMMGPVGIGIYGFRQHVGFIQYLKVVPNARSSAVVGHLYLDMIEDAGYGEYIFYYLFTAEFDILAQLLPFR